MKKTLFLAAALVISQQVFAQSELADAFKLYVGKDNLTFDAARGKELWNKKNTGEDGKERTCHTCHGEDLTKQGKHAKSGKAIDPLAPSVNKERFTELKKIEKWFKRNCKWTFGRECTNQEKGDLLTYLSKL